MTELKKVSHIVKAILTEDAQTRNSDSYLYLKVLEYIAEKNDIDLHSLTVPAFLTSMKVLRFPCFETVRRSRQKVQQTYPHLSACTEVEEYRAVNEEIFREFARGFLGG